jgi:hypothetical protein
MRFKLSYNWYRFMGISTICLLGYIVIIGIFGNTDISGFLPQETAKAIATRWPNLPFFKTQRQTLDDDQQETYFTVPTRQLTPQELAALMATGTKPKPVTNMPPTSPVAR